jgi:hypothetical protein
MLAMAGLRETPETVEARIADWLHQFEGAQSAVMSP